MHENDGGPGSILRVCAHRFLLAEGITPSSLVLMVAIRGEAVNRGYSRFALTLLNEQVSENNCCETVRKVSEMSGASWPYGPPKRDFSAHFVVRIPAKLTAGAFLRSLLGQFQKGYSRELALPRSHRLIIPLGAGLR